MKPDRILTLTVCAALSLTLCACSSGSAGSDASAASAASAASSAVTEAAEVTETAEAAESTVASAAEEASGQVVTSDYADGTPQAELAALYNSGFTAGGFSGDGEKGVQNYVNPDHTEYRQAIFDISGEQTDDFFAIDWMAEDYDQQVFDFICSCDNLEIVTPELPDASFYEGYVGKTIQELEDAGFELGYRNEEGDSMYLYFYAYPDIDTSYTIEVIPDIAADDDTIYDDEGILPLVIKSIRFYEF